MTTVDTSAVAEVAVTTTAANRFGSFSGIRDNIAVKYYVDGEHYFDAVADALMNAKETIFIEDWWLSPQLYLRRPHNGELTWRLDQVLKRRAEDGIKIYIVLYKEVEVALQLKSEYVKMTMQSLHPNILVQRHPDHLPTREPTYFWAHHEKMCIVDSKIAFLGGLDMCFGRWDTHTHRLADPTGIVWPGQDYNNPRRKDFVNPDEYDITLIDRQVFPRMPWHDISMSVHGLAALDVARHFCERWNFVKSLKAADKPEIPLLAPSFRNADAEGKANPGTCSVQICRSSAKWSSGIEHERSIQNAYIELINKAEHFIMIENQFFISNPSLEKRDISNQVAAALVQRILRAVQEGKRFRVIVLMPLMPAFQAEVDDPAASTLRLVMHYQYSTICRSSHSIFSLLLAKGVNPGDYISFYGLRNYDLIRDKNFYRPGEQLLQGFVKQDDQRIIEANKEHLAKQHGISRLFHKIAAAFEKNDGLSEEPEMETVPEGAAKEEALTDLKKNELFVSELIYIHTKVMIVDDRYAICGSANLNDRSMCGDRDSEIAAVVEDKDMIDSVMDGQPYKVGRTVQELRMELFKEHLGLTMDTQMKALCYLSPETKPPMVQSLFQNLNRNAEIALRDPLSDSFWNLWDGTAKKNTLIYRHIFKVVPDDTVTTFAELNAFRADPKKILPGHVVDQSRPMAEILKELFQVQGQLVTFPLDFLKGEQLRATKWSAESVTPEDVFT